eukprot:COSAG03_NODE_114_length_12445_cov_68.628382_8_plen_134_part_00
MPHGVGATWGAPHGVGHMGRVPHRGATSEKSWLMKNMSQLDVQVCINPVTMEILTTGRSRRRRHRGGTREQELAEAARQRDERAERRAAQAEQEQQELSVVSQLDELVLNVISRECVYLCNCPTFEATPTKCP